MTEITSIENGNARKFDGFGYALKKLGNTQVAFKSEGSYTLEGATLEEAIERAPTGAKVWFPMKFIGSTFQVYDKSGQLIDRSLGDLRVPVVHLASFSREKLMELTNMGSGRGSVKEMDGHSDWTIDINGIITDEAGHPQGKSDFLDMLIALKDYDEVQASVEVSSELLTALGIYRVVLDTPQYNQVSGTHDIIEFSLKLISDVDFELEIVA